MASDTSSAELDLDINPPYLFEEYAITKRRSPQRSLVRLPRRWFHEMSGPVYGQIPIRPGGNDLTTGHGGPPLGQRIVLRGEVLDSDRRPVPEVLLEIWQANAAGRYADAADPAFMPLDPNFTGAGRCLTDSEGRYEFKTIRPAAYAGPVGTMFRPSHIHFSLFARSLSERLITQCYFEGDPLIDRDAVVQAIPDPGGRARLIALFDHEATPETSGGPESALSYRWNIVLRGPVATPMGR